MSDKHGNSKGKDSRSPQEKRGGGGDFATKSGSTTPESLQAGQQKEK